jgi:hypothetical protein
MLRRIKSFFINKETYSLVSLFLSCFVFYPQTKLISWNIANFGQSKSDKTIHYIANYLGIMISLPSKK